MHFFRPEVERIIKTLATAVAIGAFALPLRWGYQQHQEARTWREAACVYRLREVERGTGMAVTARTGEDACAALMRLGLDMDPWRSGSSPTAVFEPPNELQVVSRRR